MHTFALKPTGTPQATSAKSTMPGRASEVNLVLQRRQEANACDVKSDPATGSARFDHDFSRIPVSSSAAILIQPKLTISTPMDQAEQEADRVAAEVMRMPEGPSFQASESHGALAGTPALHRACNCGGQCRADEMLRRWFLPSLSRVEHSIVARAVNMRDLVDSIPAEEIPGAIEEPEEEAGRRNAINRKAAGMASTGEVAQRTVTPNLPNALDAASKSGGQPLPPQTRQFMEPRFGHDFSAVRIHSDRTAADLAQRIQARAFTTGNRIFFAPGEFHPGQTSGKHLLAHELAHVVQQGNGNSGVDRQVQRSGNGGLNCPAYASYDKAADLRAYNCAGLAHRTYDFKGLAATKAALAAIATPVASGTPCAHAGNVKHWLWEYDVHYQSSSGTVAQSPPRDFHTVGGPTAGDPMAKDSDEFFTKNGKRPVYGPGTAPSFKPPAKEQATASDPAETPQFDPKGKPIYKLRSNFTESCYCAPCPKSKAP